MRHEQAVRGALVDLELTARNERRDLLACLLERRRLVLRAMDDERRPD